MWQYIFALVAFGGVFATALFLASKQASKEAQLQNLKAELKKQAEEQARANRIIDNVSAMDEHTVRQRLHEVANHKR